MDRLPIFLRLAEKKLLVIGGGIVAERKTRLFQRSGAAITLISPMLTDTLQALVTQGELKHLPQVYDANLLDGAFIVIAATADTALNRQVALDAEHRGILCNVVDDNAASSFILPAIVDRSPVIIAIGTEGTAPVLARKIKGQIEALLPARIGELAAQAGRWRTLVKKRYDSTRERRRFWQRFFAGRISEHLLAGRQKEAERAFRAELIGLHSDVAHEKGVAWIVGAGPGDPELLTLKAQRRIAEADVVVYDRLVSAPVLDVARKEADMIFVGKSAGSQVMPQERINQLLVELVRAGKRVCRLKGGDPFVFGRGGEEALALANAGLAFEVVPGITAAIGCAAYAGVPLTFRGISASVTVATAKLDGDLGPDWPKLLNSGQTLAIYMGIGSIKDTQAQLLGNGCPDDLPVAFVENGTTTAQRTVFSRVGEMANDAFATRIKAPAIIYIGRSVAVANDIQWFEGDKAAADVDIESAVASL